MLELLGEEERCEERDAFSFDDETHSCITSRKEKEKRRRREGKRRNTSWYLSLPLSLKGSLYSLYFLFSSLLFFGSSSLLACVVHLNGIPVLSLFLPFSFTLLLSLILRRSDARSDARKKSLFLVRLFLASFRFYCLDQSSVYTEISFMQSFISKVRNSVQVLKA